MAVTAVYSYGLRVFFNDRIGGFNPNPAWYFTGSSRPLAIQTADFNLDGRSDLIVSHSNSDPNIALLLARPEGGFHSPLMHYSAGNTAQLAVGHFNSDNYPDVACFNENNNSIGILLNVSGSGFQNAATFSAGGGFGPAFDGAVGDFNNDGKQDLAVIHKFAAIQDVSIWSGNGNGTFGPAARLNSGGHTPSGIVATDLNKDGLLDLVVSHFFSDAVSVFAGKAGGGFDIEPIAQNLGRAETLTAADMDRDGWMDIVLATGGRFTILANTGNGSLSSTNVAVTPSLNGPLARAILARDLNSDGIIDLAGNVHSGSLEIVYSRGFGVTYKPNAGIIGSDSFTYTTRDAAGKSTTARVFVSIDANTTTVSTSGNTAEIQAGLQTAVNQAASSGTQTRVVINVANNNVAAALEAVRNVTNASGQPVDVVIVANNDQYKGQSFSVPNNLRVVISGQSGQMSFVGASPALTVTSGEVVVENGVTFTNVTDSETILVSGGSLRMRNSYVQETSGGDRAAIKITGGSVDLGSDAEPGGNSFEILGSGSGTYLIENVIGSTISAKGNTFLKDGVVLSNSGIPAFLSGSVTYSLQGLAVKSVATPTAAQGSSTGSIVLATFNDLNVALPTPGDYTATIDWNDGTGVESGVISVSGVDIQVSGSHVYDSAGTFRPTITLNKTSPAASASATPIVSITNVTPVVAFGTLSLSSGQLSRPGSFTDPGSDSPWVGTVNYGDATGIESLTLNPDKTFSLSHTYAVAGSYTVLVTVTDKNGAFGTSSFTADVAGPPKVQSVVINDGHNQRSMVKSLTITFDKQVTLGGGGALNASAFTLVRTSDSLSIGLSVSTSVVNGKTQAVLTFTGGSIMGGSLADGNYRLTILGSAIQDSGGNLLDGDLNGSAGGNRVDDFFRFFGDTDGDRDVDGVDFNVIRKTYLKSLGNPAFLWYLDYDSDNDVDASDITAFYARQWKRLNP